MTQASPPLLRAAKEGQTVFGLSFFVFHILQFPLDEIPRYFYVFG